jgi:hypothetical protein
MSGEKQGKRAPIIVAGVANYVNVFKPRIPDDAKPGDEGSYSVTLSYDKSNTEQTTKLKKLILAAAVGEWGADAQDLLKRGKIHSPIKDGDESDDENFHGCFTITARRKASLGRPGVVDGDVQPIIDATEFYSGCECLVSVSFFPYTYAGKRGVGCGLNNVQKVADGERRGGGPGRAEDDFQPLAGATGRKARGSKPAADFEDNDDIPF